MYRSRMPAVDVCLIGAKGGYLKLKAFLQHDNYTEMRTDCVGVREKRLHIFGARVGRNIVILRSQTAHHVAHATPCEVRDMPLFTQSRRDLTRGFFHGGKFHITTVAASLWKSGHAPNLRFRPRLRRLCFSAFQTNER